MQQKNILQKIADAGLVGRGGASFPVAQKWAAVCDALKTKKLGYIVLNGAEGEPGVKKDGYIIANYPEEVINGLHLADQFLGPKKIKRVYLFLNHEYHQKYGAGLKKVLAKPKYRALGAKTEFFLKPQDLTYIAGEETALLNLIEGQKAQPRLKPPYPTMSGLHTHPALVNNTETFYNVSLVANGKYQEERFYTITGGVKRPGVYKLPLDLTIEEILHRSGNYPTWPFFIQTGGEASGEVLNSDQLNQPTEGTGSIMIYHGDETDRRKLLKYWIKFYHNQSCGQCAPCREGTYRLWELINKKEIDYKLFWEIVASLEETSFCALGSSLALPLKSYFKNIVRQ